MADRKISDLTALTTPASGDYLPIVDISEAAAASKNKRITIEELFRGVPLGTAAAPSIAIEGNENTGVYSPGANQLAVATNGTGRLFINSTGLVGIGTSSPDALLTVNGIGAFGDGAVGTPSITNTGDLNTGFWFPAADTIAASTAGSERARIDSSGRLLVGTSTARTIGTGNFNIQSEGLGAESGISTTRNANSTSSSNIRLVKTRGTAIGSTTIVQSGDSLGDLGWWGTDGTNAVQAASILAVVDGTPGADDMPGRLVFSTTADGASSPTERMRITNNGSMLIGKTSAGIATPGTEFRATLAPIFTQNGQECLYINRGTNDGVLIDLRQDNETQGTISVSGTTVSYNGAHLSRWSQLPSGAERTEILRGSVLSNLDEMCEWGNEDNEQLNRMKVSDVEGDKNVSGVFQAWDDDDDTYTNDFYCAMTGDFIIRIGDGITVERGDLLMSAGDGTAKPQDDDIIRSKTIAKVTSTNVSCTYEDGSYCVPCVLMAC